MSDQNTALIHNKLKMKQTGLAAKVAQAAEIKKNEVFDHTKYPNRLGIIIDDSGSMGEEGMKKVHEGIDAFVKNCNYGTDALAVYPLEQDAKPLTDNLALVAIYAQSLWTKGMTPLYERLVEMLDKEPITRAIAFSDGAPNGYSVTFSDCVAKYNEKIIPIDTIYIGSANDSGYDVMRKLAEATKGHFLHFTDVSVLGKSLKYLAPRLRYMLENAEIKADIEKGKL